MSEFETNDELTVDTDTDLTVAANDDLTLAVTQDLPQDSAAEAMDADTVVPLASEASEAVDATIASPKPARPDGADELLSRLPLIESGPALETPVVGDSAFIVSESPATQAPAKKRRKKWPTVLLALLVLVLGAYLAGVIAFMHVFMPRTTLNGEDVSLKTTAQVAEAASQPTQPFSLAVTGQGVNLTVTEDAIKVRYDGKAFARTAIKEQHPWLWPIELASAHDIQMDRTMTYDAMLLDDLVSSAVDSVNKDAKDPVDAKVAYDDSAKRYKVEEEQPGTRLDKAAVTSKVRDAINEQATTLELPDTVLVQPLVLSTDETLVSATEQANSCLEATQELVTRNEVVTTIGAEDLHKWLKLDDSLKLSFDSEACTKWARGELSEKLDTVGSTRNFTTPDGRKVSVSGGTYGWCINGAEIAQTIENNVMAAQAAKIEVPWLMEAATWNPGGNEWGDTYVDIDLGAQYVRYFQGGKCVWETACVTGGLVGGKMHSTPTGVYYINSNMQSGNVELKGEIDPKTQKPEYISYVKYWMPFINNSHALHDADWRDSFGGDIYTYSGSHGCVNLPPDKAAQLYGMVGVGTVVVVH